MYSCILLFLVVLYSCTTQLYTKVSTAVSRTYIYFGVGHSRTYYSVDLEPGSAYLGTKYYLVFDYAECLEYYL